MRRVLAERTGRVEVVPVSWFSWNRFPESLRLEIEEAVRDYIRRSGEEITEHEEWQVLNAAMLGYPHLLFLAAVDGELLLGFAVCRLVEGTSVTGPIVQIWQSYAWPGRARLRELFHAGWEVIERWAEGHGARRFAVLTRRSSPAYERILGELGFAPYAMVYQREGGRGTSTSEPEGRKR